MSANTAPASETAYEVPEEVAACLPVFPALIQILDDTSRQVEVAVTEVSGQFNDIVEISRRCTLPTGSHGVSEPNMADSMTSVLVDFCRLHRAIELVVMRLQFQDIVSQRLAHVTHVLKEMSDVLSHRARQDSSEFRESVDWATHLATLVGAADRTDAPQSSQEEIGDWDCDVTLF